MSVPLRRITSGTCSKVLTLDFSREGWKRDFLRLCVSARAEYTSEHKSGYAQVTNSRCLFYLMTKFDAHLLSVFIGDFPVEVVETHTHR